MHKFDLEFFIEMLKIIKNISVEFLIYSQIICFALQVKIFIKFLRIVFSTFWHFFSCRERERERQRDLNSVSYGCEIVLQLCLTPLPEQGVKISVENSLQKFLNAATVFVRCCCSCNMRQSFQ